MTSLFIWQRCVGFSFDLQGSVLQSLWSRVIPWIKVSYTWYICFLVLPLPLFIYPFANQIDMDYKIYRPHNLGSYYFFYIFFANLGGWTYDLLLSKKPKIPLEPNALGGIMLFGIILFAISLAIKVKLFISIF